LKRTLIIAYKQHLLSTNTTLVTVLMSSVGSFVAISAKYPGSKAPICVSISNILALIIVAA
jgi:hypothetical protein